MSTRYADISESRIAEIRAIRHAISVERAISEARPRSRSLGATDGYGAAHDFRKTGCRHQLYIANSTLLPDSLAAQLQPDFTLDSVRFRFTRCLALYVALSNLSGWSGYSVDFPEERAAFEKKMSSFFAQSVAFFTLTTQLFERQLEPAEASVDRFRSYALDAYEDI